MLLAIDVGNSTTSVGLFDRDRELRFLASLDTDSRKTADQISIDLMNLFALYHFDFNQVTGAILCSVVPPLNFMMEKALTRLLGRAPMVVGPGVRTGLNIRMDNPTEIGSDLIVASVAAIHDYGAPLLIVDMGTATTITAIDKDGVYSGGCICPGLKISLEALTGRTAQLPGISLGEPQRAIGKNTRDAMRSGIMFGAAAMLDGLLDRMEQELGTPATVVATGGISKFVVPLCRRKLIYDRTLMLKGLNLLYQRNVRA